MKRIVAIAVVAFVSLDSTAAPTRPVLLTGEVIAIDSQPIYVPPSNNSPVLLRNYVPEGTQVKKGDLILRIESKDSNSVTEKEIEYEQAKAKADREVADLVVKSIDADKALLTAEAAVKKAKVDAAVPREHLSGLDFDRYQGELERAEHDLQLKQKAAANAAESVERRKADGELEAKKLMFNLAYIRTQLREAEVRATRDGIVVHGYNEWRGERCDEGTSAVPGNTCGYILGSGQVQVRAWALEADRPFLKENQSVRLGFDALPGTHVMAIIERISHAPQTRTTWGSGRYFQVDVKLPTDHGVPLVQGMSAVVEPMENDTLPQQRAVTLPKELKLEGEIASLNAIAVSPPEINDVWQYNLTQLAPEGSIVEVGQPIASFDAPDLPSRLDSRQSSLNEKLRSLEKMNLDHGEGAKAADIELSQAESEAEKAARKATQPKDQIRRVDYDKLIVDRELTAQLAKLASQQRDAKAKLRSAERVALELDILRLKTIIKHLTEGLQALPVKAKQRGLVLYRLQFNGEKFAVGNQVWMGLSVASLADPDRLIVTATVPEAQSIAVKIGQTARVTIPGANLSLNARVTGLGRIYHLKSRMQPVIVRDIQLEFDAVPKGVKPGAAVQVTLSTEPSPAGGKEVSR